MQGTSPLPSYGNGGRGRGRGGAGPPPPSPYKPASSGGPPARRLEDRERITPKQQELYHNHKELKDDRRLKDYALKDGSVPGGRPLPRPPDCSSGVEVLDPII